MVSHHSRGSISSSGVAPQEEHSPSSSGVAPRLISRVEPMSETDMDLMDRFDSMSLGDLERLAGSDLDVPTQRVLAEWASQNNTRAAEALIRNPRVVDQTVLAVAGMADGYDPHSRLSFRLLELPKFRLDQVSSHQRASFFRFTLKDFGQSLLHYQWATERQASLIRKHPDFGLFRSEVKDSERAWVDELFRLYDDRASREEVSSFIFPNGVL